jgi:uncharacterized membrane protein
MVKKKISKKKAVSKKAVKKVSPKTTKSISKTPVLRKKRYGLNITRIFLFVLVLFGIYRAWNVSWVEGVSIIALSVAIWLVVELIKALRK